MPPYRILSLDGGGIRGALTASLLERLENTQPDWLGKVDLIAGTSTGGLLALGIAAGWTPAQARKFYLDYGAAVFADAPGDDLRNLGNAVGAQYSNQNLRTILCDLFGDMRLYELSKRVLISSFDLDNFPTHDGVRRTWKPKFFHNFPGPGSDGDQLVVDVALRTGAAPSYFPVYQGYIDGGVVANNPSMCALAQALDSTTGQQTIVDISLLSISSGRHAQYLTTEGGDWGWVQWARPLIGIVMEGMSDVAHYQTSRVLGRRYHRIDLALPAPVALDAVGQIEMLMDTAQQADLSKTEQWLGRHFR